VGIDGLVYCSPPIQGTRASASFSKGVLHVDTEHAGRSVNVKTGMDVMIAMLTTLSWNEAVRLNKQRGKVYPIEIGHAVAFPPDTPK